MSFRNPLHRKSPVKSSVSQPPPYVPTSTELSAVIDQFLLQASQSPTTPPSPTGLSDVQAYIATTQPSWSVPEKRRLRKFLKRVVTTSPRLPANEEMDSRSERSRRLRGITQRLFGGVKRGIPSEVSATTMGEASVVGDEDDDGMGAADAARIEGNGVALEGMLPKVDEISRDNLEQKRPEGTAVLTEASTVDRSTTEMVPPPVDADPIYATHEEDDDLASTKTTPKNRCCFLFC